MNQTDAGKQRDVWLRIAERAVTLNVDGTVAALEAERRHPGLPAWDAEFRNQVHRVIGAPVGIEQKIVELRQMIEAWERANG